MKRGLLAAVLATHALTASAATLYVWQNSPASAPPYATWAGAAATIQDAIDAAQAGDEIIVTNGFYATGGRVADLAGFGTNRVALTRPVSVRSVNGPAVTIIVGTRTYDGNAVRCAFLTNGAELAGFTLTNGSVWDAVFHEGLNGGGVWCASTSAVVSNCVLTGNYAPSKGGGAYSGTLNNCTLTGNEAGLGAGATGSSLNQCTITDNMAHQSGGGVYQAILNGCTVAGNRAQYGGGALASTLNGCLLSSNMVSDLGGGALGCALDMCTLTGNTSADRGGGAISCALNNCVLTDNSAANTGGGASECGLTNCTVTANTAWRGGGVAGGTLHNSIVYFNTASSGANYSDASFNYCCTTPLPSLGTNNFTAEPQLASASHLSASSPCRGAGSAGASRGVDIDGETWAEPPSVGCDEFRTSALTGLLSVAIQAPSTNVATGADASFTAQIAGRVSTSRWEFGDGTVVSNRPQATHRWTTAGDYTVVLRAFNEDSPEGVSATVSLHAVENPVHHVASGSTNPLAPYLSWETAATQLQDAVNAAYTGGTVLVAEGVYGPVALTRPMAVQSVDGPVMTLIVGSPWERCATLCEGASLSGFTLTNGTAYRGGGAYGGSLSHCTFTDNQAYSDNSLSGGGGAFRCTLHDCTLSRNSADRGGGAAESILDRCALTGNLAMDGGGAYACMLTDSLLASNAVSGHFDLANGAGGGAHSSTLEGCTLIGNEGDAAGGAAFLCTLDRCSIAANQANEGGGIWECRASHCVLTGNKGYFSGGGAFDSVLVHCTLTGNSAYFGDRGNPSGAIGFGGGVYQGAMANCIVFSNRPDNYFEGTLRYCCVTPLPTNGPGNISADPQLADFVHLSAGSPCIGAGNAADSGGHDIDGEAWAIPPSIGCDEFHADGITGPLTVSLQANFTNVAAGFPVSFTGSVDGHASASVWDFKDGTIVSNRLYLPPHSWTDAGDYRVELRAYNQSHPNGVAATVTVRVLDHPIHFVAVTGINPMAPHLSWATAATNIQDAVDAAFAGGTILVSNGVYGPVTATKPLSIQSINGALLTMIDGGGSNSCASLVEAVTLTGVSLTNGNGYYGGGAYRGTLNRCTITGNTGVVGGGAYQCKLNDCVLIGNHADFYGGGAANGTLNRCTLTSNSVSNPGGGGGGVAYCTLSQCLLKGNSADGDFAEGGGAVGGSLDNCVLSGNWSRNVGGGVSSSALSNCTLSDNAAGVRAGGAFASRLNNCILYSNVAPIDPNFVFSALNFCCTPLLPADGVSNFTNDPQFLDPAGGNLRLQSNSPCINAGSNTSALSGADLDDRPRVMGGTVDVGAYEFPTPASALSYVWLLQHNLLLDGSADRTDPDGDHFSNEQEWRAGTKPTDASSFLRLLAPVPLGLDLAVTWQSVPGRRYGLEATAELDTMPFATLTTNLPAGPNTDTTTFRHIGGAVGHRQFYRVRVE